MAKVKEKTPLEKKNWIQNFTLVGEAKISDYTFKINERSNKSDWIYNQLNLLIDCGDRSGSVSCELMGGYGSERENKIYVHGKDENGGDDFKKNYPISWDERFDEDILEDIGDLCFIKIGLEKDTKDKTFVKKFLTPYDAIEYVNEHLEDGMVINVKGNIRYTVYNGNVQCRKEINSIFLSNAEPKDYKATFTQTFLVDKESTGKDNIDLGKRVMYVNAYLLEKFKEYNGWDLTDGGNVKGGIFVPLRKTFEYDLKASSPEQTAMIINKIFKVKKGITQLTFQGDFIESGATVTATEADLTSDIKELVTMGMYTMEEALAACTTNGQKERRMVLTKLYIKKVGDEEHKVPEIQKFDEVFEEEDLILDCLTPKNSDDEDEIPFDEDTSEEDDLAALLSQLN